MSGGIDRRRLVRPDWVTTGLGHNRVFITGVKLLIRILKWVLNAVYYAHVHTKKLLDVSPEGGSKRYTFEKYNCITS